MLWGVTAYFNPAGYKSRLENYRQFRKHLSVPLLAVEMSPDGRFELRRDDADVVIQLAGGAVLWQKERLLNVALNHLPDDCDIVAWLDCDVIFGDDEWPARTRAALRSYRIVQLFSEKYDLCPVNGSSDRPAPFNKMYARGYKIARNEYATEVAVKQTGVLVPDYSTPGLGWAARRTLIERHRLYDARIVGSGDTAIICAALGEFAPVLDYQCMDHRQAEHYLNWARPFFAEVSGSIGYVEGRIFHLFHGNLTDRQYRLRHQRLRKFGFDPFTDIAIDSNGCWRWSSDKAEMHRYVSSYFAARNEDAPFRPADLAP